MVAMTTRSNYLRTLGDTLIARGITRIVVMHSGFGLDKESRSVLKFQDKDGVEQNRDFLNDPVLEESALKNADVLEMYLASNIHISNKDVKAARYEINPVDWSVDRTEARHRSVSASAEIIPAQTKDDPKRPSFSNFR